MSGPVNVGTSVMALKYKDGVMICADTAISYGGSRSIKDATRISAVGEEAIFSASGEMSDFQNIQKLFDDKHEEDLIENDGACFYHPRDYFNWLARKQY